MRIDIIRYRAVLTKVKNDSTIICPRSYFFKGVSMCDFGFKLLNNDGLGQKESDTVTKFSWTTKPTKNGVFALFLWFDRSFFGCVYGAWIEVKGINHILELKMVQVGLFFPRASLYLVFCCFFQCSFYVPVSKEVHRKLKQLEHAKMANYQG